GVSKGGWDLVELAVEDRYAAAVLLAAGVLKDDATTIAEANLGNFAPYIGRDKPGGLPMLMLHGRYDESIPLKAGAEPLFRLLPEPKRMRLFDSGHFPPMEQWVPVAKEWFDETLGPVSGP